MKTLTWIITIGIFLLGIIAVLTLSAPANASESDHQHHKPKTEYIYTNKDNESAKYVIGGALLTCAVISLWRQRWCWEDKTPEPFPDPGPAVKSNDVTPEQPIGIRLYQQ